MKCQASGCEAPATYVLTMQTPQMAMYACLYLCTDCCEEQAESLHRRGGVYQMELLREEYAGLTEGGKAQQRPPLSPVRTYASLEALIFDCGGLPHVAAAQEE